MSDDHSCTANAVPIVQNVVRGQPIISATQRDGHVEVYTECQVCNDEITIEYEYTDAVKR